MDRYQIAETSNGPWLELVVTNNPAHALQKARASFPDWNFIYVAKMRPIEGKDLLPEPEILIGELTERAITKYGSTTASQLMDEIDIYAMHSELCRAATGSLLDAETDILVPATIKRYGKNEQASAMDFMKAKPRLEDLM
jgi:hypothetical protein